MLLGRPCANQPVESHTSNLPWLVSVTAVHAMDTAAWLENHQGLPNNVRQKGNLENVGKKQELSFKIDTRYSHLFSLFSAVRFIRFGKLEHVENKHCKSITAEMCLLSQQSTSHIAIFVSKSRVTASGETSLDFQDPYATGDIITI